MMSCRTWRSLLFAVCHVCASLQLQKQAPPIYHNHFAVQVDGEDRVADSVARRHGFVNIGQIGDLTGHYLFHHNHVHARSTSRSELHRQLLQNDSRVLWFEQQRQLRRNKRDAVAFAQPGDPLFPAQWFINGGAADGSDMNVAAAWRQGYTGKRVTVTILDDGIQRDHPDLADNYDPAASTDINDNDDDPMPKDNGDNKHGTRCAGEVAAVAFNDYCGVGVAFNASIGGVRMLDGIVNDAVEARALSLNPQHVDIYSASWGPEDDGKTVDGPGPLATKAFVNGIEKGRDGRGSIFVWASGNGGRKTDNCNCDGYTNSPFTLSISSATQGGRKPWYLEECSSTLATTYSSGTPSHDAGITTVDQDRRLRPDKICTSSHTGTSASAPIAAGMCALALEANRELTWRDVQHVVLLTANPNPLLLEDGWSINGVGKRFSHKFGYGLMDGAAMVELASGWTNVGSRLSCETERSKPDLKIPLRAGDVASGSIASDACAGSVNHVRYLEHVQCRVTMVHSPRGSLQLALVSPSGTRSRLLLPRPRDVRSEGFDDWPFLSVHFWGEHPRGNWTLEVQHNNLNVHGGRGVVHSWQLIFWGTSALPDVAESFYERRSRRPVLPKFGIVATPVNVTLNHVVESRDSCAGGGSCECAPRHYFGADKACHPCHVSCRTCYGSNGDQCLSCTSKRVYVREESRCVEKCPDGYLSDGRRTCESCPQNCRICDTADSCVRCDGDLAVHEGKCVANCPSGSHKAMSNDDTVECRKCHPLCDTCVGPRSSQCARCVEGHFYYQRSCVSSCPKGFVAVPEVRECLPCPTGCDECDRVRFCTKCSERWSATAGGKCVPSRQGACGGDRDSASCQSCHASCAKCFRGGKDGCISCPAGHRLHISSCIDHQCPSGTFVETSSGSGHEECRHCPHACNSCLDSLRCTSCYKGYFLLTKASGESECVDSCGFGFHADTNSACVPCNGLCRSCNDARGCTSCEPERLLTNEGKCSTDCPEGFFASKKARCAKCHPSCGTCKGPGHWHCLSCSPGLMLNHTTESCTSCETGRYYSSAKGSCEKCHRRCRTCDGPGRENCTSCRPPLVIDRWNKTCVPCCSNNDQANSSSQKHASAICCGSCKGRECSQPTIPSVSNRFVHLTAKESLATSSRTKEAFLICITISVCAVVLLIYKRWKRGRLRKVSGIELTPYINGNFGTGNGYRQITSYDEELNADDAEDSVDLLHSDSEFETSETSE